ncbi:hypothetical protein [Maridesulfovibrio hydrothermalis]|uniref:Homoserine dehydrogenase, NAD binding domain n=1 Tax=Maridesulfovibrio hydrothermalis AM13 = DSM 14728 TaxID=1121451 RepID=L0R8H3_9BACT|nr:hypothetical protein [Maridesulfovibrio hydrothermalis]CCO22475.1 conserved protein of unknown function [Maridesulfovibrio hydrothermalis AM13 = DSM 14728]
MENHNIAIVGLGRIGTSFLEKTLTDDCVMKVKAVCELYDTKGKRMAEESNIQVVELSEIVGLGVKLDVIFDLTGDDNVSRMLRSKLEESGNTYTQVAQNRLARLVWALIADDEYLPDVRKSKSQVYADMLLSGQK